MKNKILILLISLFSIFIISDRVDALSFNVNGVNYNVNSIETLRDYNYFTYVKDKDYNGNSFNYLIMLKNNNYYTFYYGYASSDFYVDVSNPYSGFIYTRGRTCSVDYNNYTLNSSPFCFGNGSVSLNTAFHSIVYSNIPLYSDNTFSNIYFNSNYTFYDIESKYGNITTYDIKYYLNNELYDTITVEGGSSHTLKDNPSYDSSTQYWSGWTYDNNIDLSNITSDVSIYGTITDKNNYIITYYLNNEVYRTDSVIEGNSYTLLDYIPPKNYNFSGWTYDNNYNFNDVRENMNIYGSSVFVRPGMNYSEDIDSPIHNLSVSILGREIPVEFDFLYTIMDFIILILLVICVLAPFIIVFKLLGGGF